MKKFRVNYIFICSQSSAIGMRNFKPHIKYIIHLFLFHNASKQRLKSEKHTHAINIHKSQENLRI